MTSSGTYQSPFSSIKVTPHLPPDFGLIANKPPLTELVEGEVRGRRILLRKDVNEVVTPSTVHGPPVLLEKHPYSHEWIWALSPHGANAFSISGIWVTYYTI